MSMYDPRSPSFNQTEDYNPESPVMDIDIYHGPQYTPLNRQAIEMDFPPLLPSPKKPRLNNMDAVMDMSSDSIAGPSQHYQPAIVSSSLAASPESKSFLKGKEKESLSSSRFAQPASSTTEACETTKTVLLKARDLIVKAYDLATSRTEQSQLLDLLEVFREYTEKGNLCKASTIIATQVANLETATRQIEIKARALENYSTSGAPSNQPRPSTQQYNQSKN